MAIIQRNDPFRDLLSLQNQLYRTFDGAFGNREQPEPAQATWTPSVDVFEDEQAITLKADLPEVELKDIELTLDGNQLTLKGTRALERQDKREGYHRIERSHGAFARTFTLPDTVDAEHIAAQTKDGVLRVVLPKKAETRPRQIKVQVDAGKPTSKA